MKKVNFLTTLSPREQQALTRWYRFSLYTACIFGAAMLMCQGQLLYTYVKTKRELQRFLPTGTTSTAHTTESLQTKKQEFESRLSSLTTTHAHATVPKVLTTCTTALGTATMRSLHITNDGMRCTLQCKQPRDALAVVRNLNKENMFTSVKLTNLQTQQDAKGSTIQATLVATLPKAKS